MKKLIYFVVFVSVSLLTACTVTPAPKTTVTFPNGVQVQTNSTNVNSNGSFCPPGQAKKGRC